ncbi:hypothetical protein DFH07DRAFT_844535 [Mycena maculata]|uniref:MYND-type domain-containing protein n=1 Tax=Mycena maculata TaxID=230809 RepID=A0AAD7I475_9AGAR|nr:hypothetical protein DFH07DRAFT_844535 [Mycena maculata]
MSYETLPTAQQAIDEFMLVANISLKGYVCTNCAAPPSEKTVLRLCGRCKLTRYCSQDCQKTHWKQHKHSCRLGAGDVVRDVPAEYRAQKFAEHLTHVPWLMILIQMYAVVALRLDVDATNAACSCLCARITTKPVSSRPDAVVMLQFEKFEIKPVSVLTDSMRNALKTRPVLNKNRPPLLLYFSTDGDNYLFMPLDLPDILIEHARRRPVFDDGTSITEEKVVAELNEFIRLDTNNVCKLRGGLLKR